MKRSNFFTSVLGTFFVTSPVGLAQGPHLELLKDINPGAEVSYSLQGDFVSAANGMFFTEGNWVSNWLWYSDGTVGGTKQIHKIDPPSTDPPSTGQRSLGAANGGVVFVYTTAAEGQELWRSDGTAAGTYLLKDIYPGSKGSAPGWLTALNGTVYFIATSIETGTEIWKTDGTGPGTVLVADSAPGTASSNPFFLTASAGKLYFSADDVIHGRELWVTDGTAANTGMVKDIVPGLTKSSYPDGLVSQGGYLYFGTSDGTGVTYWRTTGTEATTEPLPGLSFSPTWVNNGRFYSLRYGDGGITYLKATEAEQPATTTTLGAASSVIQAEDGTLYAFSISVTRFGSPNIWRVFANKVVDTTLVPLGSFGPFSIYGEGIHSPVRLVSTEGSTIFCKIGPSFFEDFYRTDGTVAGTQHVGKNPPERFLPCTTYTGKPGSQLLECTDLGGVHYFFEGRGLGLGTVANDGTVGIVKTFSRGLTSNPTGFNLVGNQLLFGAADGGNGGKLWRTDGSPAGTTMVKDVNYNYGMKTANGLGYFGATADGRTDVWKTDGTDTGTQRVTDQAHGTAPDYTYWGPSMVHGSDFYYSGSDGGSQIGIWKTSDGNTPEFVSSLRPREMVSSPQGIFLLAAPDPLARARGIWRSSDDGLTWSQIHEAIPEESIYGLNVVGGRLHFSSSISRSQNTNWVETFPWSAVVSTGSYYVRDALGGTSDYYAVEGSSLRVSTGGNLNLLKSFATLPWNLTRAAGNSIFFQASLSTSGTELWTSDGTVTGTRLVADIRPGAEPSQATPFFWTGTQLYFAADDGLHGSELWVTDGTTAGTRMVLDANPGPDGSVPMMGGVVNERLVISLDLPGLGREPWALDIRPGFVSYAAWSDAWFAPGSSPEISSKSADPDADGSSNLQEYSLGTPPQAGSTDLPPYHIVDTPSGKALRLIMPPGRDDVAYAVEFSPTLSGPWISLPNTAAAPVYSGVAPGGQSRGFFRIRVSLVP